MPFHSWLPAAMVAPTPVSTYLHSATMVKAGVYLVARLAPAFDDVDFWRPLVVTVGVVTMIGGGLRALRRTDLKLLLADGTVSQLGLMIAVFGWGTPTAEVAGSVMLLAHGAFKAAGVHGRRHRRPPARHTRRPRAAPTGPRVAARASPSPSSPPRSMAGIPLLFGFVAKEADFAVFVDQGGGAALALAGIVAGSALTVAYSIRFVAGVAGRLAPPGTRAPPQSHGPPRLAFVAPGGAARRRHASSTASCPMLLDPLVSAAASALDRATTEAHLELWHGLELELLLSAVALAAGIVLFAARARVDRTLAVRGAHLPTASAAYGAIAARPRGRRRPRDHRGPARLAAALPRRDPAHRRASCRERCCSAARGGRAGPTSSTCRPTCRSPPC